MKAQTDRVNPVAFANQAAKGLQAALNMNALPAHKVRAVAVAAEVDPRSVRRYLAGQRVQPSLKERIERALRAMDLIEVVASGQATARKE